MMYSGFAGWQLSEIHSGARDTHDLAVAAKRQADKAETISNSLANAVDKLGQQAKAAQDSVTAIQKQTMQDQRASLEISPLEDVTTTMITNITPVTIPFKVVNAGKTDAIRLSMFAEVEVVGRDDSPNFRYSTYRSESGLLHREKTMHVTAQTRTADGKPRPLGHPDYHRYDVGEAYFAIYGRVTYWDIFGVPHWTQYCAFKTKAPPGAVEAIVDSKKCEEYNRSDNN